MNQQTVRLKGKRFVLLERQEYEDLRAEAAAEPPLPKPDAKGYYPAQETLTVLTARDIIRHRRAVGLTQQELARLVGIRLTTLRRIEQAEHVPSVRLVDKIDRVLRAEERRQKGNGVVRNKAGTSKPSRASAKR